MLRKLFFLFITLFLLVNFSMAQGHGFGLGFEIGTPTGLSAKAWLTRSTALQFGLGVPTLNHTSGTLLSMDYLWHVSPFQSHEIIPLYYGIGGLIGSGTGDCNFGVRAVGGIAWMPHGAPIDIYAQITPTLYLQNSSHFEVEAALGMRFFF